MDTKQVVTNSALLKAMEGGRVLLSDNIHKNQPIMAGFLVGSRIISYPLRNSKLVHRL